VNERFILLNAFGRKERIESFFFKNWEFFYMECFMAKKFKTIKKSDKKFKERVADKQNFKFYKTEKLKASI
jgi:hypothetical protein